MRMTNPLAPPVGDTFSRSELAENAHDPEQWTEENISQLASYAAASAPEYVQETISALMRSVKDGAQRLKEAEYELMTDALTGLSNRRYFMARLEETLFYLMRYPDEKASIAFIDLNKFKPINDTYGHEAGDEALKAVAELLSEITRRHEVSARLGGDEFCVLSSTCTSAPVEESSPSSFCKRLQEAFEHLSIEYDGHIIDISASIGVVEIDPKLSADENLKQADAAMYGIKKAGGETRH